MSSPSSLSNARERIAAGASVGTAVARTASSSFVHAAAAAAGVESPLIAFDEESSLLDRGHETIRRFWQGFIDFAMQGNMLEFAFGLILANAFTDLIQEFVTDILMPPISFLMPVRRNMEEKFWVLHPGRHFNEDVGYNTLQQARADGAVVMAYG
jgi:large conductance mechanosensitive channel